MICMLAYNLFNWFKRLVLPKHFQKMQIETFRLKLIKIAARVIAFCAAQWPPVRLPVATRRCQWPGLISHFSFNHNDVVFRHPLEQRVG